MGNKYTQLIKLEFKLWQLDLSYSSIRASRFKLYYKEFPQFSLSLGKLLLHFTKLPF